MDIRVSSEETGLYYLQSRYYDPEIGRFISQDEVSYLDPETINGLNLYAYCLNDPIMMADPTGYAPEWLKWLGLTVGAVLVIAAVIVLTIGTAGLGAGLGAALAIGAAKGALIGAGIGVLTGGIIGGTLSAVNGESFWSGALEGAMIGFGAGALIGAVIGGAVGGIQFASAAKAWAGGSKAMTKHFLKHGVKMGFKNPVKYTKAAQNVIQNGTYIARKNAFATLISAGKYNFVGVMQGSIKITTFGIRTFTKTVANLLGLLL